MCEAISKAEMVKVSDLLDWAESVGGYCGDEVLSAIEAGKIPVIPTDVDEKMAEELMHVSAEADRILESVDVDVKEIEDTLKNALIVNDRYDHYNAKMRINAHKWLGQLLTKIADVQRSYDEERAAHNAHMTELLEKEAEVEKLRRVYDVSNQQWREMFGKLNQAVEALKRLSVPTPYENPHSELRYRQLFAKEALQSIKGGDPK